MPQSAPLLDLQSLGRLTQDMELSRARASSQNLHLPQSLFLNIENAEEVAVGGGITT